MTKLHTRLAIATAVAGLAVSMITAPSVAVASAGTTTAAPHAQTHTSSPYLAGYRATEPTGHVEGVVIKAVDVPDVSCPGSNFRGIALGGGSEPVAGSPEYFGGILIGCFAGQPLYNLDARVGDVDNQTGVEPGDQVQIVITLNCDDYPTCHVFSSATSLDTDMSVSAESDVTLTSDSAVFGAFPHYDPNLAGSAKASIPPVPVFAPVRFLGCLFGQHLLTNDAEKLTRIRHHTVQLKATKIHAGSYTLKNRTS